MEDGFHAIGEMYEYGETGHIDFIKAREYYEKAAKTGNPSSQVLSIILVLFELLFTMCCRQH